MKSSTKALIALPVALLAICTAMTIYHSVTAKKTITSYDFNGEIVTIQAANTMPHYINFSLNLFGRAACLNQNELDVIIDNTIEKPTLELTNQLAKALKVKASGNALNIEINSDLLNLSEDERSYIDTIHLISPMVLRLPEMPKSLDISNKTQLIVNINSKMESKHGPLEITTHNNVSYSFHDVDLQSITFNNPDKTSECSAYFYTFECGLINGNLAYNSSLSLSSANLFMPQINIYDLTSPDREETSSTEIPHLNLDNILTHNLNIYTKERISVATNMSILSATTNAEYAGNK